MQFKRTTPLSPLMLAVLMALSAISAHAAPDGAAAPEAQKPQEKNVEGTELDEIEVIGTQRSRDERGKDRVYTREISNVYIGKKDLDNYRGTSVGDIFKAANGVYAGDARNSGAIDANIRGIQGQGRIPVTIDGTEQSVAVFLGTMGLANRSYIDPNIIGGITVEKGPSLTRGVRSGIGGAVIATTLEADDVLLPGRKFGIDIKADTGSNSLKPHMGSSWMIGKDYRDLPGVYAVGTDVNVPSGLYGQEDRSYAKTGKSWGKFDGADRAARVALAYKDEPFEAVAAYSYRKRGNYYAGSGGSDDYMLDKWSEIFSPYAGTGSNDNNPLPYLAAIHPPQKEVPNTSSDLRSLLLKTTLNLPHNQKLKLGYLNTKHTFGESIPWYSTMLMKGLPQKDVLGIDPDIILNMPFSKINNHTYNLQYSWQPEDNRWIDLQAQAWLTQHHSERHQSGDLPWGIKGVPEGNMGNEGDGKWDGWVKCFQRPKDALLGGFDPAYWQIMCGSLSADKPPQKLPNTNGEFNIAPVALQIENSTRFGFNLSNTFHFSPRLALTLGGDLQHEKLHGFQYASHNGVLPFSASYYYMGPRAGTRREYRLSAQFDWQPSDWLKLMAGGTYSRYWSFDDRTAEDRRHGRSQLYLKPQTHTYQPYLMLATDQDARMQQIHKDYLARRAQAMQEAFQNGTWTPDFQVPMTAEENTALTHLRQRSNELMQQGKYGTGFGNNDLSGYLKPFDYGEHNNHNPRRYSNEPMMIGITDKRNGSTLYYWDVRALMPLAEGKDYPDIKDNPFHNGDVNIREKVSNPQGVNGEYLKYVAVGNSRAPKDPEMLSRLPLLGEESGAGLSSKAAQNNLIRDNIHAHNISPPVEKRRNHAWAPMFAATVSLSDHIRVYGRYSEAVRFPSLYEDTQVNMGLGGSMLSGDPLAKPERTQNWEVGYIHDLTGFFPKLRHADFKLNYYHNTVRNYIDRSTGYRLLQFDRKKTSGIELQARVDSGRYFADLGVTYRLKNTLCDASYAAGQDMYYAHKYKACVTAGFPYTFSYMTLQPKYSVNLSGGMRLMDEKLTLGGRVTYHASGKNKDSEEWRSHNNRMGKTGFLAPFGWHPIMVFDAYADWKVNKHLNANFSIENITNRYYSDPLARVPQPAPARTVRVGVSAKF